MEKEHWLQIGRILLLLLGIVLMLIFLIKMMPEAIHKTFYEETTVKVEVVEVRYSDKLLNQLSGKEYQTVVRYDGEIYVLEGEGNYYTAIEKVGMETDAVILKSSTFDGIKIKELK